MGSPRSLICRPSALFFSAALISFSPSSFGTSQPGTVSGSVVDPILPSWETRIAVSSPMWSTCFACARNASMRFFAAGLVAPAGSFHGDVDLLAGVAAEALLGQLTGRLRLGARRVVVGIELAGERAADADDHHRGDDPGQHHAAAPAVREVCETSEMTSHQGGALLSMRNLGSERL
jgi:hypothetical protein